MVESVWFMTNFATTKLRQSVSATKNMANKMATTSVARFGKKLSLWHVDHLARKVWQATSVAINQTHAGKPKLRRGNLRLQTKP